MSRHADHDERRRQIAESAAEVAVAGGIGRVTVAGVARQAGVSVGLVQHYFPGKELLMARTYEGILASVDARVAQIVARGEVEGLPVRRMAADALSELLPQDGRRRSEGVARAEFRALALRSDLLREVAREGDRAMRARLRRVVGNAQRCGETGADVDATLVAERLWAAAAGAVDAMLADPSFPGVEVVGAASKAAFPHPCRHHVTVR